MQSWESGNNRAGEFNRRSSFGFFLELLPLPAISAVWDLEELKLELRLG